MCLPPHSDVDGTIGVRRTVIDFPTQHCTPKKANVHTQRWSFVATYWQWHPGMKCEKCSNCEYILLHRCHCCSRSTVSRSSPLHTVNTHTHTYFQYIALTPINSALEQIGNSSLVTCNTRTLQCIVRNGACTRENGCYPYLPLFLYLISCVYIHTFMHRSFNWHYSVGLLLHSSRSAPFFPFLFFLFYFYCGCSCFLSLSVPLGLFFCFYHILFCYERPCVLTIVHVCCVCVCFLGFLNICFLCFFSSLLWRLWPI